MLESFGAIPLPSGSVVLRLAEVHQDAHIPHAAVDRNDRARGARCRDRPHLSHCGSIKRHRRVQIDRAKHKCVRREYSVRR